jgi:PAS domain-containing protein
LPGEEHTGIPFALPLLETVSFAVRHPDARVSVFLLYEAKASEVLCEPSPWGSIFVCRSSHERRLVDALERISDGFVALDREWRYTYVNATAAKLLGRRPEELIGRNIWTEFPEGIDQPFYHAIGPWPRRSPAAGGALRALEPMVREPDLSLGRRIVHLLSGHDRTARA